VGVSMRVSQHIKVYINPKSAEMAERLEAAGNTSKMRTYQTHASSSSVKASKSPHTKSPDSKSSPNERASRPGKFERECVSFFSLTPLSLLILCLSSFLCTHPHYQLLNILGNLPQHRRQCDSLAPRHMPELRATVQVGFFKATEYACVSSLHAQADTCRKDVVRYSTTRLRCCTTRLTFDNIRSNQKSKPLRRQSRLQAA
jgi:hypothetical protein